MIHGLPSNILNPKIAYINKVKLLLIYLSFHISCQHANEGYFPPPQSNELTWIDKPKEFGFSPEKLSSISESLKKLDTTSMMILIEGKVLFEYGDVSKVSYLASARKSILAMLFGKYVTEGKIDLNWDLNHLEITDIDGLLPSEKKATIKDLLSSKSGIYHPAANSGDEPNKPERGSKLPGTYFLYNNWDFNTAGAIFEKIIKKDIFIDFKEQIAEPIGMQDYRLNEQKKTGNLQISQFPAFHFWLSTRDMARIGLLMLEEGKWNGKTILNSQWLQKIRSLVTPLAELNPEETRNQSGGFGYGYMWWVADKTKVSSILKGAYSARGQGGQYITVIPARKMVIAHKVIKSDQNQREKKVGWKTYLTLIEQILSPDLEV